MTSTSPTYLPVAFADLQGWRADDHAAAFRAFVKSCPAVLAAAATDDHRRPLASVCRQALGLAARPVTRAAARAFFERYFTPHRIDHAGPPGLLTGYYEPVLQGSRVRTDRFPVSVYRRPSDLVNVVEETRRGAVGPHALTHVRQLPTGERVPYFTRAEIEGGAISGRGLELVWIGDDVELFFLQVQGSGRIRLRDGSMVRIGYDGKNGHPYTSIGRYLIDAGEIGADRMSLDALGRWLRADVARGREVMRRNASYVFFKELPSDAASAVGAMSIPLTPGRSLAVDATLHALGSPVYVVSPTLRHAARGEGFARLMIAQDVGSAIMGPERGDIYFGSGPGAGRLAGVTKSEGRLFVLMPRAP